MMGKKSTTIMFLVGFYLEESCLYYILLLPPITCLSFPITLQKTIFSKTIFKSYRDCLFEQSRTFLYFYTLNLNQVHLFLLICSIQCTVPSSFQGLLLLNCNHRQGQVRSGLSVRLPGGAFQAQKIQTIFELYQELKLRPICE